MSPGGLGRAFVQKRLETLYLLGSEYDLASPVSTEHPLRCEGDNEIPGPRPDHVQCVAVGVVELEDGLIRMLGRVRNRNSDKTDVTALSCASALK